MRNSKNSDFMHAWMLIDCAFYFSTKNILTASQDHVLDSVFYKHETFSINATRVTRTQPTINNCFCRGVWPVPVTTNQHRAKEPNFTTFANWQCVSVFVSHFYFHWGHPTTGTRWSIKIILATVSGTKGVRLCHAVSQLRASAFHTV